MRLAFAWLSSMVLKPEDQITPNCSGSATMTVSWAGGSVASNETPSASLLQKLGIEDITPVLRCRWLRWYGHVQRATSYIKSIINFMIPGSRKQEQRRPSKAWSECVKTDVNVNKCGLAGLGVIFLLWKNYPSHRKLTPLLIHRQMIFVPFQSYYDLEI